MGLIEYIFIEIPCASYVLKDNYHYFSNEHCSYLDSYSLNTLMGDNGYCAEFIEYVFNEENIIALYKKINDYVFIGVYSGEDYPNYITARTNLNAVNEIKAV